MTRTRARRRAETLLGTAGEEARAKAIVVIEAAKAQCQHGGSLFRDFAATYRERRRSRWKPSSLKTQDSNMRNRLMPAFGRLRLDTIDQARVFPEHLTTARLYTFWVGVRDEAALHCVRIHDARHTYASQGVMNGVGLTAVGKLPGHRKRAATAIYAQLDDAALRDAVAQAATVIARATDYKAAPLPLPGETNDKDTPTARPESLRPREQTAPRGQRMPLGLRRATGKRAGHRQNAIQRTSPGVLFTSGRHDESDRQASCASTRPCEGPC